MILLVGIFVLATLAALTGWAWTLINITRAKKEEALFFDAVARMSSRIDQTVSEALARYKNLMRGGSEEQKLPPDFQEFLRQKRTGVDIQPSVITDTDGGGLPEMPIVEG